MIHTSNSNDPTPTDIALGAVRDILERWQVHYGISKGEVDSLMSYVEIIDAQQVNIILIYPYIILL